MDRYTDKKEITKQEYFALMGILRLGAHYEAQLKELEKLVIEITGEREPGGHGSDALYCDYSVDTLLDKLGISRPALS